MDPQKLSQLDPKLREAYQRVMGTSIPQPQVAPIQTQTPPPPPPMPDPIPMPQPLPTPEPVPSPIPTIEEPPAIPTPEPAMPEPVSEPQPAIPQQPPIVASNFVQMNSEVAATPMPQAQTMTVRKKQGMMTPVLFGIVGLVFIAIYTLFWTKIFNFQLPFLP